MTNLFYIIFFSFSVISFSWYLRILKVSRWIRNNKKWLTTDKKREIFVVIPILDEVGRIENTTKYFLENFYHFDSLHIVLVTTEKENEIIKNRVKEVVDKIKIISDRKKISRYLAEEFGWDIDIQNSEDQGVIINRIIKIFNRERDTIEVARKLALTDNRVSVYHCPFVNGKMAHQLNYAIKAIIQKGVSDDALFAVYNADSRPDKRTFDWVFRKASEGNIKVFQQYGNYLKNIKNFKGWGGSILIAAALWQTRWSIGFEIFNALKQLRFKNRSEKKFYNYPLNYCIGHGLFFTKDIFLKLDGFSEQTHNEDAIFGLELSYDHELIMPVPYFDESDSPDTVKSLYLQKASWFFGPLQAYKYYGQICNKRKITKTGDEVRLLILTAKLFSHALYWVLGPTFFFLSLWLALAKLNFLWLVLAESILFLTMPDFFAWLVIRRKGDQNKNYERVSFRSLLFGPIICYFFHGLSAYRALAQILITFFFGKPVQKQKTQMVAKS